MKSIYLLVALSLSGCISVNLPELVSDTAKVTKDTYKSVTANKNGTKNGAAGARSISHSYIGKENQTVALVKQNCISEAASKLTQMSGKEIPYSVIENNIVTLNNNLVANCKLALE